VWVEDDEIARMAEVLGMQVERFEDQFVRRVGTAKSLKEYPDGDCMLLDPQQRTCLVYEARPVQCRTWPFWDSNVESEQAWQDTCQECPGAGTGQLYTFEQIEVQRRQRPV
jgi:Fe-S-cluster containining protein